MSVATAVVGGAVVGGVLANKGAKDAAKASAKGTQAAADSTLEATRLQIEEIQRQFDYQMDVLRPQIEQQYGAQSAYSQLLGIPQAPDRPPVVPGDIDPADYTAEQTQIANQIKQLQETRQSLGDLRGGNQYMNPQVIDNQIAALQGQLDESLVATNTPSGPEFPDVGSADFTRREDGSFVDPNLTSDRFSGNNREGAALLLGATHAARDPANDRYTNYIDENQIAADTLEEDLRFQRARDVTMTGARGGDTMTGRRGNVSLLDMRGGDSLASGAAGTGVYGETFTESPGYNFMIEEMDRALDRRNSAGGNYGGRAIMEAQRRAQGLAAGEYYNWARGRTSDLERLASAEAMDASRRDRFAEVDVTRGDRFAESDLDRLDRFSQIDIGRGDAAVDAYEGQRVSDVTRGDRAFENWLARNSADIENILTATRNQDARADLDIQRDDQAYYNYLANLGAVAGFSNPAGQAVNASQGAGQQLSGAYRNQGGILANLYANQGNTEASIANNRWANINNSIQAGIGNWITADRAGL